MDYGRAVFQTPFRVHHGGQWFVVNRDKLQRVPGDVGVRRHHHGHRLAFVVGLVRRHGPPAYDFHVVAHAGNGKLGVAKGVELHAGHYRQHSRQCLCCTGVDLKDSGVSMRTAQHHHLRDVPRLNVCGVAPFALNQAEVLFSPY